MENEFIKQAANINYLADEMISKIKEIREQYDAAQASPGSSSLISGMKRVNRPELRKMNTDISMKVTEFLGGLDI
jgi:hypothetical protein